MARRLGSCRISLPAEVAAGVASRWTIADDGLEVSVTTAGIEEHDVAMELLLCLGQGLWERLADGELRAYWMPLCDEISMEIEGEIDEQALDEKRSLFESRSHANNVKRLTGYVRASFAGTVAEYVHCLWHEVTVRTGPDYLPAAPLRRRLELMARWFPPNRVIACSRRPEKATGRCIEVKLLRLFLGRVPVPDTEWPQGLHSSCSACQSSALPYRFP